MTAPDEKTLEQIEAAAFRRLVAHLRARSDVQNIALMTLAGFCRNCLADWRREAAEAIGVQMTKEESRDAVYGMPYADWKTKFQKEPTAGELAAFEAATRGKP